MKCPSCGKEIDDKAVFCTYCVKQIVDEETNNPTNWNNKINAENMKNSSSHKNAKTLKWILLILAMFLLGIIFTDTSSNNGNNTNTNTVPQEDQSRDIETVSAEIVETPDSVSTVSESESSIPYTELSSSNKDFEILNYTIQKIDYSKVKSSKLKPYLSMNLDDVLSGKEYQAMVSLDLDDIGLYTTTTFPYYFSDASELVSLINDAEKAKEKDFVEVYSKSIMYGYESQIDTEFIFSTDYFEAGTYPNDKVLYYGQLEDGRPHGKGVLLHRVKTDINVFKPILLGNFTDGYIDGYAIRYNVNEGNIVDEGYYKEGFLNGLNVEYMNYEEDGNTSLLTLLPKSISHNWYDRLIAERKSNTKKNSHFMIDTPIIPCDVVYIAKYADKRKVESYDGDCYELNYGNEYWEKYFESHKDEYSVTESLTSYDCVIPRKGPGSEYDYIINVTMWSNHYFYFIDRIDADKNGELWGYTKFLGLEGWINLSDTDYYQIQAREYKDPEYSQEEISMYVTVQAYFGIDLNNAPDDTAATIRGITVPYGEKVPIIMIEKDVGGEYWGQTYYDGRRGWIKLTGTDYDEKQPQQQSKSGFKSDAIIAIVKVNASDGGCYFREGPSSEYDKIFPDMIPNGEELEIVRIEKSSTGYEWGYTVFKGKVGWVALSQTDYAIVSTKIETEYVIEGSDTGYVGKEYLSKLSDEELRLARNEIYARHGRRFDSSDLQIYFNSKSWYTPLYSPEEFDPNQEEILNAYEKANRDLIQEVEASRK